MTRMVRRQEPAPAPATVLWGVLGGSRVQVALWFTVMPPRCIGPLPGPVARPGGFGVWLVGEWGGVGMVAGELWGLLVSGRGPGVPDGGRPDLQLVTLLDMVGSGPSSPETEDAGGLNVGLEGSGRGDGPSPLPSPQDAAGLRGLLPRSSGIHESAAGSRSREPSTPPARAVALWPQAALAGTPGPGDARGSVWTQRLHVGDPASKDRGRNRLTLRKESV